MASLIKTFVLTALLSIPIAGWGQAADSLAQYTGPDRQAKLEVAAKKEGSLYLYTTTPVPYAKRLIEPFEKKYGIKVELWRARSELILQRVIGEARSGKPVADIVVNTSPPMEALHREKLLQKIISPAQKGLMDGAVASHHEWTSINLLPLVQAYNTNKVKKADLPKTYQDLLDPKWKGQLGIEGNDSEWVTSVIDDMGEKEGEKFFEKLISTNGLSVRFGHPLLMNLVGSGEVPLGLTVHQYGIDQAKAKGAPIEWFAIEPAVTITVASGVLKQAPHPNAALLFYDYLLSESAQAILSDIGYYATNLKIKPPFEGIKLKVLDAGVLLDEEQHSYDRFERFLKKNALK